MQTLGPTQPGASKQAGECHHVPLWPPSYYPQMTKAQTFKPFVEPSLYTCPPFVLLLPFI